MNRILISRKNLCSMSMSMSKVMSLSILCNSHKSQIIFNFSERKVIRLHFLSFIQRSGCGFIYLSGLNVSGDGQISGSWWTWYTSMYTSIPLGMVTPAIVASSFETLWFLKRTKSNVIQISNENSSIGRARGSSNGRSQVDPLVAQAFSEMSVSDNGEQLLLKSLCAAFTCNYFSIKLDTICHWMYVLSFLSFFSNIIIKLTRFQFQRWWLAWVYHFFLLLRFELIKL